VARRERTTRMRRVDAALREVLAEAVARELSDPRLGFVTITRVEATQDTREAKVWFSTLRSRDREASLAALESARGLLQGRLAAQLRSRHTPQLTFHYDSTQQDAARLTKLIDEVADGRPGGEDA
jgi:ribosome-binding factor A